MYVWLLFRFKADHKAARMVMSFSAQDGAILADYRNEAECSLLAKGKNAKVLPKESMRNDVPFLKEWGTDEVGG